MPLCSQYCNNFTGSHLFCWIGILAVLEEYREKNIGLFCLDYHKNTGRKFLYLFSFVPDIILAAYREERRSSVFREGGNEPDYLYQFSYGDIGYILGFQTSHLCFLLQVMAFWSGAGAIWDYIMTRFSAMLSFVF